MPNALVPLQDSYQTVVRPIAASAALQIVKMMRLQGTAKIIMPGSAEAIPLRGGSFNAPGDVGIIYPSDSLLEITFEDIAEDDRTLVNDVNRNQNMALFHNKELDIRITPVYRQQRMRMNLKFSTPNRSYAQRWLNDARNQRSLDRAEFHMTLDYYYTLPAKLREFLESVHSIIRNGSIAPIDVEFMAWFEQYLNVKHSQRATQNDTFEEIVFNEQQVSALGWFDFVAGPENIEKNESTYSSSFTAEFLYNQPTQLHTEFPLVVHQTPVDSKFYSRDRIFSYREFNRRTDVITGATADMNEYKNDNGMPYLRHPEFDDWMPRVKDNSSLTFCTVLIVLDPDNPRHLFDLNNLIDFKFTPEFLEYFEHAGDKLFGRRSSPFVLKIYKNRELFLDAKPTINTGTLVESSIDLDYRSYYHAEISLNRCWAGIDPANLEAMRRYPYVAYWTLRALDVYLGYNKPASGSAMWDGPDRPERVWTYSKLKERLLRPGQPRPSNPDWPGQGFVTGDDLDGIVRKGDWDQALKYIDDKGCGLLPVNGPIPVTVLFSQIVTNRKT